MNAAQERFRTGLALHQSGRSDEAAAIYESVLRDDSTHAGAWHLLGVVLSERGNSAEALEHIERALSFCNSKAVYWNNYGAVLRELGRHQDAKHAFEQAIRLRNQYPDAWSNLGLTHLDMGDLAEAERALNHALDLQPGHADALLHLAVVHREKGDFDAALRFCRESSTVGPERAEVHDVRAGILAAMRQLDDAAKAYEKALDLNPGSIDSQLNLGLVRADLDETEPAREAFTRAAALRPDRPMWRLRHLSLCPPGFRDDRGHRRIPC